MHTRKKKKKSGKKKFMPAAAEVINYLLNEGNLSYGPSGRARLGSQAVPQRSTPERSCWPAKLEAVTSGFMV